MEYNILQHNLLAWITTFRGKLARLLSKAGKIMWALQQIDLPLLYKEERQVAVDNLLFAYAALLLYSVLTQSTWSIHMMFYCSVYHKYQWKCCALMATFMTVTIFLFNIFYFINSSFSL